MMKKTFGGLCVLLFGMILVLALNVRVAFSQSDTPPTPPKAPQAAPQAAPQPAARQPLDADRIIGMVKKGYICPNTNMSIEDSAAEGQACPAGDYVVKMVTDIINCSISEENLLTIIRALPQGKSIIADTGTQPCEIGGKLQLDFFIMSYCPYGVQFVNTTLKDMVKDLGGVLQWTPYYLVNRKENKIESLHGPDEADEDLRQVCIRDKWGREKWLGYMDCFSNEIFAKKGAAAAKDWKYCSQQAGVDATELQACFDNEAKTLIEKDILAMNTYAVESSPTGIYNCSKSIVGAFPYDQAKKQVCKLIPAPKPETCAK